MRGPRFCVRPARLSDVDALVSLAQQAGGGFTNLPPHRGEMERRIHVSEQALQTPITQPAGELYIMVCTVGDPEVIIGTASLFSKLGVEWPFYSYRIIKVAQTSRDLNKVLHSDVLHLVNDFDGHSEVGGLFLLPTYRGTSAGRLLARSRYLFIAQARARFADKIIADLRGYADAHDKRPFWEAVGRHFFDMDFEHADHHNSLQGNQFIADLMPKYPIYVRLLPQQAQEAIGRPHEEGAGAFKLLMDEGFRYEECVDIFDAGPTLVAHTDALRTLKHSQVKPVSLKEDGASSGLVCAGSGLDFRATLCGFDEDGDTLGMPCDAITCLGVEVGAHVRFIKL